MPMPKGNKSFERIIVDNFICTCPFRHTRFDISLPTHKVVKMNSGDYVICIAEGWFRESTGTRRDGGDCPPKDMILRIDKVEGHLLFFGEYRNELWDKKGFKLIKPDLSLFSSKSLAQQLLETDRVTERSDNPGICV